MGFLKNTKREVFILSNNLIQFRHSRALGNVAINTGAFFHSHSNPEITYVIEGHGYHITENTEYELKKDTLILTPPGVHHKINIAPDKIYERYYIGFDQSLLDGMNAENIYNKIEAVDCSKNQVITDIFKRADYYANKFDEETFFNMAKLLVKELFYNLGTVDTSSDVKSRSVHPVLSKAIDYINNNITSITSVKEISDSLFITERYLYELFKTELLSSPKKYINEKRLHFAREEILKGENPGEVCFKVGFLEYSTFYRSYKKHFGYPPSKETTCKININNLK